MIYIGIDPGVKTGVAVWDNSKKEFLEIYSCNIVKAMKDVENYINFGFDIKLRIEDARKRKWFGNSGREKLQGAGSIKRDCKIWEEYCEFGGIRFEMTAPKNSTTKMKSDAFKKLTKWTGRTNEHARDAAMLVFGK